MSLMSYGQLLRSNIGIPLVQTFRHRSRKPNLRRPAIPHWQRAVVLKVTEPMYEDSMKDIHPAEICKQKEDKQKNIKQVNPFEQILARELLENVEKSKMVAIFHRNPMSSADLFAVRVQLSKIGMFYQHHNNSVAKLAFTGTKYEALLQLYQSHAATFTSDELRVAKLLKLQKKMSGVVLLAGVVEGRLMSVSDLQRYAALPSLSMLQSQLVGILNAPLQQFTQSLSHHQTELSVSLNSHVSDTTSEATTDVPSQETSTS